MGGVPKVQYVWNLNDRWDLIGRRRSVSGTLDEARYVLKDSGTGGTGHTCRCLRTLRLRCIRSGKDHGSELRGEKLERV